MLSLYVATVMCAALCAAISCWPAVCVLAIIAIGLVFFDDARDLTRKVRSRRLL